jgi:hypothetical protein
MTKRLSHRLMGLAVCGAALVGAKAVAAPVPARVAAAAPASGDVKQWVDQKVADCEPRPEERRFDETGWVADIRTALKLAKEHNRPVFLFTHDGHMAVGRC